MKIVLRDLSQRMMTRMYEQTGYMLAALRKEPTIELSNYKRCIKDS